MYLLGGTVFAVIFVYMYTCIIHILLVYFGSLISELHCMSTDT